MFIHMAPSIMKKMIFSFLLYLDNKNNSYHIYEGTYHSVASTICIPFHTVKLHASAAANRERR